MAINNVPNKYILNRNLSDRRLWNLLIFFFPKVMVVKCGGRHAKIMNCGNIYWTWNRFKKKLSVCCRCINLPTFSGECLWGTVKYETCICRNDCNFVFKNRQKKIHNICLFSVTTNTHFAKNFIMWQLVLTLDSAHHQVMTQECECIQRLSVISWIFPLFTL